MQDPHFTALGKEVLHNGQHYADAATPGDAEAIAYLCNLPDALDARADRIAKARGPARILRIIAGDIRGRLFGD